MNSLLIVLLVALDAAMTFGAAGRFQLEESRDGFGMRSHGVVENIAPGRTKLYPLPQSTPADFARLRAADARINPLDVNRYERQEVIGPHRVDGGKLWFGNSYYDGEGDRGVGAFGYFDTATRTYTIYRPPEAARWQASAILVEPERVWLALDRFGEDISTSPGGLLEWDRTSHAARKYDLEFVVAMHPPRRRCAAARKPLWRIRAAARERSASIPGKREGDGEISAATQPLLKGRHQWAAQGGGRGFQPRTRPLLAVTAQLSLAP